MYWNQKTMIPQPRMEEININMRCIEIKNIKGLHNGYSGLTLTWDVLKYESVYKIK